MEHETGGSRPRDGSPSVVGLIRHHPLPVYFGLALSITWLAWAPPVLTGEGWFAARISPAEYLLGALGPAIAALVVTGLTVGLAGVRELLRQVLKWRVSLRWYLAALIPFAALLVVAGLRRLLGSPWPDVRQFGETTVYPQFQAVPLVLATFLLIRFGEEMGWRGYALPRLQQGRGALSATLIVGSVTLLWHLPLLFFPGGLAHVNPGAILGWYLIPATGAVFFTWLYNSTGGSLLIPSLLHAGLDVIHQSKTTDVTTMNALAATLAILALLIVIRVGRATFWGQARATATAGAAPSDIR